LGPRANDERDTNNGAEKEWYHTISGNQKRTAS
jgi:hypothetical protein